MADGSTSLGFTLPEVFGSVDTWGSKLNGNWGLCDSLITTNKEKSEQNETDITALEGRMDDVEVVADAALPKAGGTMTGRVEVETSVTEMNAMGDVSGATEVVLAAGNYVTMTLTADITLTFSNLSSPGYAQIYILDIISQGYKITWPGSIAWAFGEEPILSDSGGRDIITVITTDGSSNWTGAMSQPDCQ